MGLTNIRLTECREFIIVVLELFQPSKECFTCRNNWNGNIWSVMTLLFLCVTVCRPLLSSHYHFFFFLPQTRPEQLINLSVCEHEIWKYRERKKVSSLFCPLICSQSSVSYQICSYAYKSAFVFASVICIPSWNITEFWLGLWRACFDRNIWGLTLGVVCLFAGDLRVKCKTHGWQGVGESERNRGKRRRK